ncbi:MAG TPA: GNAT family N-acetyltransferase [Candidatus Eremiobacteraceae bacterium]
MDEIIFERVQSATDEVRALIGELDQTLAREYLPEQQHGLRVDTIFQPHVRFFVARLNGRAVGCGGVALFESYAEVKRMYVRDAARGRGVARALLARIESETRSSGLDVLRLETGDRQFDAIRLYERAGFRRCDIFGEYSSMAPHAVTTSIFFEKQLAPAG